jgi:hypothetical protein
LEKNPKYLKNFIENLPKKFKKNCQIFSKYFEPILKFCGHWGLTAATAAVASQDMLRS